MAKGNPLKGMKKFKTIAKRPTGMAAIKFYLMLPFTTAGQFVKNWVTGRLSRKASLAMEFLTVAIVVTICIIINIKFELQNSLGGPAGLRNVWLGLVAFLSYLTLRLSIALFRQFPENLSQFPDIQIAIETGKELTYDAQIELHDVPVFLVLGATAEVESAMSRSSFIGSDLRFDPKELPVHWYGDNDALWITLPGVSAVSEQTRRWEEGLADPSAKPDSYRMSHKEKDEAFRRLKYTMKQLRKLREGVVPINGVVMLVPFQWMTDSKYSKLLDTIKLDMFAAQTELGVKCECVVLFHGIEQQAEFQAYSARFPESVRQGRCGCTLPQFTQHMPEESAALHRWLFDFFRQQIYGFFAADVTQPSNQMLFRFLNLIEKSRENFSRILTNAFPDDVESKMYLSGVYFVELSTSGHAFFDGVVARLRSDHDEVIGWTPAMLKRNQRISRLATVVTASAIGMLIVDTVFIFQRLFGN